MDGVWFFWAWTLAASAATPLRVVALGDGLVAGPPAAVAPTVAAAWVTSLEDCLDERAAGSSTVLDHAAPGETVATAREKVARLRTSQARLWVITLGAQELAHDRVEVEQLVAELADLLSELRDPATPTPALLVGMVPPTLAQAGPKDAELQAAIDARTVRWNQAVGELAEQTPGARFLDVWSQWPRDAGRLSLTKDAWHLSAQGHALVAAAVCDAVLSVPLTTGSP